MRATDEHRRTGLPDFPVRRKVGLDVTARIFGLTGGIGSGKSTVASLMRERGIHVVDADELARKAVEPGTSGLDEVLEAFGRAVLRPDGTLNRTVLGRIVFSNPVERAQLNAILHPKIQSLAQSAFQEAQRAGHKLIAYEAALLFETGAAESYSPLVVVNAPVALRRSRVVSRDGFSEAEFERRDRSQLPLIEKVRRAHFVIENDQDLAHLGREVDRVIPLIAAFSPQ